MKLPLVFLFVVSTLNLSGCQTTSFYTQSVIGHSRLMLARQPVDSAIKSAEPQVAQKLRLSKQLLDFAVAELSLPVNKSYRSYVDLKREYPVWVVVAAPPFSLRPKQWCYPVIGCAAYRGYFSESSAIRYAAKLKRKGFDVHVGGAAAYSTLGWFSDPLLPSMLRGSDASFAEVLFHELAHQRLYINNRSDLNEAFATLVGEQGAIRWLTKNQAFDLPRYQARLGAARDFAVLVADLKTKLGLAFDNQDRARKQESKAQLFEQFKLDYQTLRTSKWEDVGYYDSWVNSGLNNAKLAAFSTYYDLIPQVNALFEACDNDFERFYQQLEKDRSLALQATCE